ncbi:MAG TPA: LysE family translocator [Hydrogenophaga sp.]
MNNAPWLAASTFALIGAITPGPVNFLAIRHGESRRTLTAFWYVLGASLSYTLVVWLSGTGSHWALQDGALITQAVRWLGAAYLLYLAWKIATAPPTHLGNADEQPVGQLWRSFSQGFLTQVLNPKAWLVALSGVGLYVLSPHPASGMSLGAFSLLSLTACFLGVGAWAWLGGLLTRWLHTPRRQRALNLCLAALLALSVLGILL